MVPGVSTTTVVALPDATRNPAGDESCDGPTGRVPDRIGSSRAGRERYTSYRRALGGTGHMRAPRGGTRFTRRSSLEIRGSAGASPSRGARPDPRSLWTVGWTTFVEFVEQSTRREAEAAPREAAGPDARVGCEPGQVRKEAAL